MIGFTHYLLLGTILFGIGIFGVLSKRNAVAVLMSMELMLNAVNINFVAISKYATGEVVGQMFALFVIVVAAAEVAVGLALILAIFRQKKSVNLNDFNLLKW